MLDLKYQACLTNYLEGFVSSRRRERLKEVLDERTNHLTIVLEDVYQSHNFSAVLRSADIFGIQHIHFIENRNKYKISEDVSMGSTQWLSLHRYQKFENNTIECLNQLKNKGYRIVATTPHEKSVTINRLPIEKPLALIFGTELTGISEDVKNMADEFVSIPMYGFTESFNISVSAALCMHELSTKIRAQLKNYQLSEAEKKEIYLNWLKVSIKKDELVIKEFDQHYYEGKNSTSNFG
ncbi:MAG: TrmH family RNA methyltransferase [Bacteroidota bacterium]|jgi:tRNA (guanosine-2'-O-)-methyltransferase